MASLQVKGTQQLGRLVRQLEEKGNSRALKRRMSKTLRAEADPITRDQRASLAAGLPKRGGAAETISAESTMTVTVSPSRATVTITDSWRGHDMKAIDAGDLRHPVFGRRKGKWYDTSVPRDLLTGPFLLHKRAVQIAMLRDLAALAEEIARGV